MKNKLFIPPHTVAYGPAHGLLLSIMLAILTGCSQTSAAALETNIADLVVYTCQEEAVYEPILKEYQERTGLTVQVISGTYGNLQDRILAGTLADDCDVVFGINSSTLERTSDCWDPYISPDSTNTASEYTGTDGLWTGFSALPLVIMYNTRVVTYRELPEGWHSLLEPRWKGRIAFMNPDLSDIYSSALTAAVLTSAAPDEYISQLAANLDYTTVESLPEVNLAIAEGRCFLGVTLEEKAESLRREGADVDYIYPREGTCVIVDGSAVVAGCRNPEQARAFIDFTVSRDVQQFLTANISRRSIRTDAEPPPGLAGLSTILLLPPDVLRQARSDQEVLAEWNTLISGAASERR